MHPPRENSHCKRAVRRGAALAESTACARRCRVCLCYTIWPTPIIRCRSASLAVVQPNHRLPEHSTMRRAQQCRYFARSLPPRKRHSRLTTVRRGCCQITTRRDSWRSHVHRTHTAQRVQLFEPQAANVRGQGAWPLAFSWGSKGAILSRERMAPLFRAAPAALLSLADCKESIPSCIIPRLW